MLKTLLVEDNSLYRGVLKKALKARFGKMETREASGPRDALETLVAYQPDLIFMDINLNSSINGLDLTREIKVASPHTIIIILSQYDIPEYRSVAEQNGADHFLSKSTPLETIFEYVDSVYLQKNQSH